jgi:hypothetical protein
LVRTQHLPPCDVSSHRDTANLHRIV